jgi:dCMP deaminase
VRALCNPGRSASSLLKKRMIIKMKRINKTQYYLSIAAEVAKRSTCIRRQYGAVIVKNDEIVATGYNGSPRGEENCCDIGECWREQHNIPHGEQYEKCVAVHAEQNAIISASRRDMLGATMYIAGFDKGEPILDAKPCDICRRLIKNAGIDRVVTNDVQDFMPM